MYSAFTSSEPQIGRKRGPLKIFLELVHGLQEPCGHLITRLFLFSISLSLIVCHDCCLLSQVAVGRNRCLTPAPGKMPLLHLLSSELGHEDGCPRDRSYNDHSLGMRLWRNSCPVQTLWWLSGFLCTRIGVVGF